MLDNDLLEGQFYLNFGFFIFDLLISKIYRRPMLGITQQKLKLQESRKKFYIIKAFTVITGCWYIACTNWQAG